MSDVNVNENASGGKCGRCFITYIPAMLATVAAVCGISGNLYCETVKFPQNGNGNGNGNDPLTIYAGVFSYRTKDYFEYNDEVLFYSTCRSYSYLEKNFGFDYDIDSKMKTTMAFAAIAGVIGGLGLVAAYIVPCITTSASQWKALGAVFLLTCIFQGITLMVLQSTVCLDNPVLQFLESERPAIRETFSDECEWAPGFRLNITAVIFWFAAGVAPYVIPVPVVVRSQPVQSQTVTYQQNLDGTVEETNVTIVQGTPVNTAPAKNDGAAAETSAAVEAPIEESK